MSIGPQTSPALLAFEKAPSFCTYRTIIHRRKRIGRLQQTWMLINDSDLHMIMFYDDIIFLAQFLLPQCLTKAVVPLHTEKGGK